ncbi:MAG: glycoside hydrolase family 97 N-terminal domain-containing protein, partial [Bacteroidaceae bacterium]|nr:glycoside hydrolase family 97 N-terminal domain-containing protein [Bacteroidaceae bacterium]
MKKIFAFALGSMLAFTAAFAQENQSIMDLKSPDGRLVVSFNLTGTENPTYSVKYDGKQMLEDSPIGIMLDLGSKPTLEGLPQGREAGNGDFTKNLTLAGTLTDMGTVD